jgi:hypothetical protein
MHGSSRFTPLCFALAIAVSCFPAACGSDGGGMGGSGGAAPQGGSGGGVGTGGAGTGGAAGAPGGNGGSDGYGISVSIGGQPAQFTTATAAAYQTNYSLSLQGFRSDTESLELSLVVTDQSNVVPGTYHCEAGALAGVIRHTIGNMAWSTAFDVVSGASGACTIDVTEVGRTKGEDVAGTFTATLRNLSMESESRVFTEGRFRLKIVQAPF